MFNIPGQKGTANQNNTASLSHFSQNGYEEHNNKCW
jgi:hypothetical protein